MGKDISSRGVTDLIFISTGLHCQGVLRGDRHKDLGAERGPEPVRLPTRGRERFEEGR